MTNNVHVYMRCHNCGGTATIWVKDETETGGTHIQGYCDGCHGVYKKE